MMIQKNLKGLERMEVLITSHMKAFRGNKYNSLHTARILLLLELFMRKL